MRFENHFSHNWRQQNLPKNQKLRKQFLGNFLRIFLKSPVSRIVPKNVKGGPFGNFFNIKLLQNIKTLEGTLGRHLKILVKGETRTHVLLLRRLQKILINLYAKWQKLQVLCGS